MKSELFTPIFQRMKLKFRKIHYFAPNHTTRKWQSCDFNPNLSNSKPGLLPRGELPLTWGSWTSPNTEPTPEPPHNQVSPLSGEDLFTPTTSKINSQSIFIMLPLGHTGPLPQSRLRHQLFQNSTHHSRSQSLCIFWDTRSVSNGIHWLPSLLLWTDCPMQTTETDSQPRRGFQTSAPSHLDDPTDDSTSWESHYPMQSAFFSADENENTYPLGLS